MYVVSGKYVDSVKCGKKCDCLYKFVFIVGIVWENNYVIVVKFGKICKCCEMWEIMWLLL